MSNLKSMLNQYYNAVATMFETMNGKQYDKAESKYKEAEKWIMDEHETLVAKIEGLVSELTVNLFKVNELEQQKQELIEQYTDEHNLRKNIDLRNYYLESQVESLEDENGKINMSNSLLLGRVDILEQQNKQLEAKVIDLEAEISQVYAAADGAATDLINDRLKYIPELRSKNKQLEADMLQLSKENVRLERCLDVKTDMCVTQAHRIAELEAEKKQLLHEMFDSSRVPENQQLRTKIEQLRDALNDFLENGYSHNYCRYILELTKEDTLND